MEILGSKRKRKTYARKIMRLFGADLLGYWPLSETSGSAAKDISGHGYNSAYDGSVVLGSGVSAANKACPFFGPTLGSIQSYGGIAAAINPAEFSIGGFAKVNSSAVWSDATARYIAFLQGATGADKLYIRTHTTNNTLVLSYLAGGVDKSAIYYPANTGWFHWLISVSKAADTVSFYINGAPFARLHSLGLFSGAIVYPYFGSTFDTAVWHGWLSDMLVIGRAVTDGEALALALAKTRPIRLSLIGDSISAAGAGLNWVNSLANSYNSGFVGMINHAAGGATIISQLAGQVAACSADGADVIILALGTNDNNAGDMAALRAAVEAGIDSLKASNPGAKVYYMNVLPKWTDNSGVSALNETNIRAAIALACANKNIPCWDTFSTPWISAADTSDGTHPTAAGHAKIAAQVWARLAGG